MSFRPKVTKKFSLWPSQVYISTFFVAVVSTGLGVPASRFIEQHNENKEKITEKFILDNGAYPL